MASVSNFDFLNSEFAELAAAAKLAERAVYPDPHGACFHCRRALELTVRWLYKVNAKLNLPYEQSLGALLHEPSFQNFLPEAIFNKAKLIQRNGNLAVHGSRPVYQLTALQMVEELHHLLYWVARTYTRKGAQSLDHTTFDKTLVPFPSKTAAPADKAKLKKQEDELTKSADELKETLSKVDALNAELEQSRKDLAEAKAANEQVTDSHDYSEAETRKHLIDAELRRCGWDPNGPNVSEYQVSDMPNTKGVGFVDYVLWGENGKPLAVVEAKKASVDPQVGKQQAKLYADSLEKESGQRPLIFYTNGYTNWLWADCDYPPRQVAGFYKHSEMERLINRRKTRLALSHSKMNTKIVERYYQHRAIASIGEVFTKKRRKTLLVMATGTGKTRMAIALVDLLQRCNWVKNALFLADRVSLVNQAVKAFKQHLPECSPVNLVTEKQKSSRVSVCTYPTMMGLIDDNKNGVARFSPGHFDIIVIDEAHRSIYQKYRSIFEYFDSLLVGLTATPREEVDKNTYELFDLEPGVPTDAYELEQAVSDEFLVPPKSIRADMKFPRDGVKYDDLSEEDKETWESIDWGDHVEDVVNSEGVSSGAVNKWFFNNDTADKMFELLFEHGHKVDGGDRLAKTIIFAKNHKHALFIEERFNHHYPDKKGHFARIIDNYAKYPQSLIDAFSLPDSDPHIAISVDMMDTGIDVPEVANLVFFKPIYSKIKFWQMIGRGTRLCSDLHGPGDHKTDFRVLDLCGNFDYFDENPDGVAGSGSESLSVRLFRQRVSLLALTQVQKETGQQTTNNSLFQILREHVASMNPDHFQVRMKLQIVEKFQSDKTWERGRLSEDELSLLFSEIATLPDGLESENIEARQFDLTIINLQIAIATGDTRGVIRLSKSLTELASALEEKANIPAVHQHLILIQSMQTQEFWEDITLDILEDVRVKLRELVHLIDTHYAPPVYTNLKDEILGIREGDVIDLPTMTSAQYEKKVRATLAASLERIEIQKLRQGKPLTPQDVEQLEQLLITLGEEHGTELLPKLLERTRTPNLIDFIRSCVGMDRIAAQRHFSKFLENTSLAAPQIRFIELIIDQLTKNGIVEPDALYEPPFSQLHAGGPDELFPDVTILDALFEKVQELRNLA